MKWLVFVALAIRFLVLFLLLMGTNQLCGAGVSIQRLLCGALVGLLYGLMCMEQELFFLGNRFWYFVFTGLIAVAAFGLERPALRPVAVFLLINLILEGIAADRTDVISGVVSLVGLGFLYLIGFWEYGSKLVPVELSHRGRQMRITALRDTGNQLVDPVTGRPMLIVGADVALKLVGLTPAQLKNPVDTVGEIEGLRLVPYSTIGQAAGLMLAMRVQQVKIGKKKGSALVAFAPENIGAKGSYQGLTGGYV